MFVNIHAAARHVEMVEAFGLPNPSDPHYEEIFGLYHVIDDTCYWSYHPATQVWDVKVCSDYDPRDFDAEVASSPCWTEAERLQVQEKVRDLSFLPRPALPKKRGKVPNLLPFLYEGWLFTWKFDRNLKRWEIAPLARR
ncbi:hypothetical protein [Sphingobium estronivorans]|uniref:hypothetical protein n=1 Tax=Sphingobium estronivorans TaxID=1577690 RepID=UPI00123B13B0|nr:hypothetical protein [Sphingobium estronivorans]